MQFVALLHVYRGDRKYVDLQMKLSYFEQIEPSVELDCWHMHELAFRLPCCVHFELCYVMLIDRDAEGSYKRCKLETPPIARAHEHMFSSACTHKKKVEMLASAEGASEEKLAIYPYNEAENPLKNAPFGSKIKNSPQNPYLQIRNYFFQDFQNPYLQIRIYFFQDFQNPYLHIRIYFFPGRPTSVSKSVSAPPALRVG